MVRMNTFRKMVKRKRTQPTTNRDDVCTKKPRLRYSTQNDSRSPDLKIVRILNRPIKKIQKFFEIISKRNNDPESLESYKKAVQIMERYNHLFFVRNSKLFSAARILVLLVTKQLAKKVCSKDRIQSKLIKKVITQLLTVN